MKHILRCYYLDSERYPDENNMLATCEFLDEHGNENYEPKVYEYLATTMSWDIYLPDDIQKHFEIIKNIEANPNEIFDDGGGQHRLLFKYSHCFYPYPQLSMYLLSTGSGAVVLCNGDSHKPISV